MHHIHSLSTSQYIACPYFICTFISQRNLQMYNAHSLRYSVYLIGNYCGTACVHAKVYGRGNRQTYNRKQQLKESIHYEAVNSCMVSTNFDRKLWQNFIFNPKEQGKPIRMGRLLMLHSVNAHHRWFVISCYSTIEAIA